MNQCDGCRAGIPVDEKGYHRMGQPNGYPDCMACQKKRYLKVHLAREFALKAHGNQKYGETEPYETHLRQVVGTLIDYGVQDENMLAAGWLHDTCEDCPVALSEIEAIFGPEVATFVHAVTNEPGKNRKERHEKTYPKIKACPGATTLKLADRISNVKFSVLTKASQLGMYRKEHATFKEALYVAGENEAMWAELERLLALNSNKKE